GTRERWRRWGSPAAAETGTLDGGFVRLARADSHPMLDRGYEDLAVADFSRTRGLDGRVDGALDLVVRDHDLDLHLRQEIDHVLGAAIKLGMSLLAAEALDPRDAHPGAAHLGKRF